MDLTSNGISNKRAKRYLDEIHTLTSDLLSDTHSQFEKCVEAEKTVTLEGLRLIIKNQKNQIELQNQQIIQLKKTANLENEIKIVKQKNDELHEKKKYLEIENEATQKKLQELLDHENGVTSFLKSKNEELKKKLEKQQSDFQKFYNQFSSQRKDDAEKLNVYIKELESFKLLNYDLNYSIRQKNEEFSNLKFEFNELKQKFKNNEINYTKKIDKLENDNLNLTAELTKNIQPTFENPPPLNEVGNEREQYLRMKNLYYKYKLESDEVQKTKQKLKEFELELEELQNYKIDRTKKQKQIENFVSKLAELELSNLHTHRQLDSWINVTKQYIQDEPITPEALARLLFGRFSEIQILTHKNTANERANEDLHLQIQQLNKQINDKENDINEVTGELKVSQNKVKKYEEDIEDLNHLINLLKIEKKGEKLEHISPNLSADEIRIQQQQLQHQIDHLKFELAHKSTSTHTLQQEKIRLQSKCDEIPNLEYQIQRLTSEKAAIEKQNVELLDQVKLMRKAKITQDEGIDDSPSRSTRASTSSPHKLSSNYEELELISKLRNDLVSTEEQRDSLMNKCKAIKDIYRDETTAYRQAILSILGWNIKREMTENGIRYRINSLFSTHDGELIFYPKTNTTPSDDYSISEFDLYFDGYYINKWTHDLSWKNKLSSSQSYPAFLATTCLEELANLQTKFKGRVPENSSGILLPSLAQLT